MSLDTESQGRGEKQAITNLQILTRKASFIHLVYSPFIIFFFYVIFFFFSEQTFYDF